MEAVLNANLAPNVAIRLGSPDLCAVASGGLRLVCLQWRDYFGSSEVWRDVYKERWRWRGASQGGSQGCLVPGGVIPLDGVNAIPWRQLYLDRHLGEVASEPELAP